MMSYTGLMRRLLLFGVLFVAGCATSPFERHLAAGRWNDAAHAFRADSSLLDQPRALYRAALVFASPDRDTYDPAAARELFDRLITQHPRSQYADPAQHYTGLLDEIERVRNASLARQQQLERQVQQLQKQIVELQSDIASLEAKIATQSHDAELMTALVVRLEGSMRRCEEQLREARAELDNLKAIDLRNPPRSGGGTRDSSTAR